MKNPLRIGMLIAAVLAGPVAAQQTSVFGDPNTFRRNDLPEETPWAEKDVSLPTFPKDADLLEFYVAAVASNHFFIDRTTLSVGEDGVVRYVLVVKTSGGATNVTFEGIRCETGEYKTYAIGHGDGTWAKARNLDWKPIENKPVNRHHAALKTDYFCAEGTIRTPQDGIAAIKRQGLR